MAERQPSDKGLMSEALKDTESRGNQNFVSHHGWICIDEAVNVSHAIYNITVTLSTRKGVAQPWRFFFAYVLLITHKKQAS